MTSKTQHAPANPGFLDVPAEMRDPESSAIHILPVPYDLTSSWHKGADSGPEAMIAASAAVEWYDIETNSEVCRHGIYTLDPIRCNGSPEELAKMVDRAFDAMLHKKKLPVLLGGEHSVSIGSIQATARHFPKGSFSVLQIDAHGDTRESYEGSTHNHACIMARARDVAPIVQVGIRAIDQCEVEKMERDRVFFAHEIVGNPDQSWMDRVIDKLADNVYITIDLDAFDPGLIPATGTPEPGGMSWYEVNRLVDKVTKERNVVAFDVVELIGNVGSHASEFAAAKLVYRVLSMVFANR